jgi:hypothetical protein
MVLLHITMLGLVGEPPDVDAPGLEVLAFWNDVGSDVGMAARWIDTLGLICLLLFAVWVGAVMRNGGSTIMSTMFIASILIVVVTAAVNRSLTFALATHIEDMPTEVAQTLHILVGQLHGVFIVGMASMHLAFSIGASGTGIAPIWLARITFIPAVILLIPHEIAWVGFPITALWIIVTSLVLFQRARSETVSAGCC